MKKFKDGILPKILCGVAFVIMFWLIISYFEIMAKNTEVHPSYSSWNFFSIAEDTRTN